MQNNLNTKFLVSELQPRRITVNIIYVSSTCSRGKYTEYVESKGARVNQQAQRYNLLLAEGLAQNGAKIKLISSRPINRAISSKLWFKEEKETVNGINFKYIPFINHPLFRVVFIFLGVFFGILFSDEKKKNTVVICDAMNIFAALATIMACKLRGFPTLGIITDVPCYRPETATIPFYQRFNLYIMKKFGSFLFLTAPMSEIVNPDNKPFLVLEGHSDMSMLDVENDFNKKHEKKVCIYAGSLRKVYGIEALVKGFLRANIENAELHLYGNGSYADELKVLSEQNPTIIYKGIAPNEEVIKEELKATLLINPRPTHEEYTKYSFPSKNMEYMASGTPVLTTCLPGMPDDHKEFVFFIKEENEQGIEKAFKEVFEKSPEELHTFGLRAKEFILKEKNNVAQAKKVIRFVESIFN